MSVWLEHWPANTNCNAPAACAANHTALWLQSGAMTINGNAIAQGSGCYLEKADQLTNPSTATAVIVRIVFGAASDPFTSDSTAIERSRVSAHSFSTNLTDAVLRFDQVDFPESAIAYKHTHPGAGVRYLVEGGLQLDSDHGTQHFSAGDAWFEEANSPVKATAIDTMPSRFIRLMLLPVAFEGHPTLTLVNADDASKPRLQTNTRHFDQRIVI